jgi:MoaA/NifB/PqqE/SkfB family radical SAM enzyme
MISTYNVVGEILFSQTLLQIRNTLEALRKDTFDPHDRIVIHQDEPDVYHYVDGVGKKLIQIQQIINQVDISNCFILLETANVDISREINFITTHYSVDSNPIEFLVVDGAYKKTIQKYQDTACKKLWNHLYVGTDGNVNPCCVADHRFPLGSIDEVKSKDDVFKLTEQIRSEMIQGYRNRACAVCYEKEDSGIQSVRQVVDTTEQPPAIKDLDIRLNNICNFKCRMCSEYFSSAIQQETVELYGKDATLGFEKISLLKETKSVKNQRLENISLFLNNNIESIYFAGGEPLITAEHYEILDRIIEIGNTDLKIRYNTNLSTLYYKKSSVLDRWQQFSDITVGASIDASGDVAEYIRHGTVWNEIVNNINLIKNYAPHVKLNITSAVSFLTIENLIDLQNTWIEQRLFDVDDFHVSIVVSPIFLSPAVLPQHHKDRLNNLIQAHIERFAGTTLARQWQHVLQWMNSNDYTFALKDFKNRTYVLDQHRNESFVAVFSKFKDLV